MDEIYLSRFFIVFVIFVRKTETQGCYQWNHSGRVSYQTFQYTDPTTMTIKNCENYCLFQQNGFAAIEAGQYCFCGTAAPNATVAVKSNCNVTCSGNPADVTCGSYRNHFWLVNLTTQIVTSPIINVTIAASYSSNNIGDQIIFNVKVNPTVSYDISFNYGDGSPQTDFYPPISAPNYRKYYAPGKYLITAFVKDPSGQIQSASTNVEIMLPLSEVTSVVCPSAAKIGEIINCTFTIGFGENVTLNLNFGDSNIINMPISDTLYYSTGLTPPNNNDSSAIKSLITGTSGKHAFMKMSDFKTDGIIYAFQTAYHVTGGSFMLKVICPVSACNYCFESNACNDCPEGVLSASPESTTCAPSENLYFNALDEICYTTYNNSPVLLTQRYSSTVPSDYSQYDFYSYTFSPSTVQNWMPLPLGQRFPVKSGCVLGYVPTQSAFIYYRNTEFEEVSDSWVSLPGYSSTATTSVRHFLKAYSFQPQIVTVQHTYSQDGLFTVSGIVTDGRSTVSLNSTQVLVGVDLIVNCPPFAIINRQIVCSVISPNASLGGTYFWSFSDGPLSPSGLILTMPHTYTNFGTYEIIVTRQSQTTTLNITYNTTIDVIDCFCCPPVITPLQMSLDYLSPILFKKSQSIKQSVLIQLTCNETLSNDKIWSLEMTDGQNPPNAINTISLPINGQNYSSYKIEPYTLEFGLYRIKIKVKMNTQELIYGFPIESELYGYFQVVPADLIPVIYHNQSRVSLTYDSSILFDPGSDSIDPNEPPGSARQYTSFIWDCRTVNGNSSLSTDSDIATWIQNCKSATGTRNLGDLSWGYVNIGGADLAPGIQYVISVTITRTVTVYSKQITLSGTSSIIVDVVASTLIPLTIQCQNPETCFSSPSTLTVNPTNAVLLTTICAICPIDAPSSSYLWNVTDVSGNAIPFANFTEGDGTQLYLSSNFFTIYPANPLLISVAYSNNGKEGNAFVQLNINSPPVSGSCSINGTSGNAAIDLFYITCQNWYSSTGIASYTLYRKENDQQTHIIFSVPVMGHVVSLPPGIEQNSYQYDLWIIITDTLGATTDYFLATMTITPYVPNDFDIFAHLNLLSAQGDLASILAFVDAVSTSANSALSISQISNVNSTSFSINQPQCFDLPIDASCDNRTYASWVKAKFLDCIKNQPIDSILDVISISNTISHIISPAEFNINQTISLNSLLSDINDIIENSAPKASPELILQTVYSLFSLTTIYANALHYNFVNLLPLGDQIALQRYEYENYDVSLPENPNDIIYYELLTTEQWQLDAARRAQIKSAISAAEIIHQSVDNIVKCLIKSTVIGEAPVINNGPYGQLFVQNTRVRNLTNPISLMNNAEIDFGDFCLFSQIHGCNLDYPIQAKIVYYTNNLYHYADTLDLITTGSIEVDFTDPINQEEIVVNKSTVPVKLKFDQNVFVPPENVITPSLGDYQILKIHRINITKSNSTLELDFTVSDPLTQFALYARLADYVGPMQGEYDFMTYVSPNQYPFKWVLPSIENLHKLGIVYVGVGQLSPNDPNAVLLGSDYFLQNFTTDYTIGTSSPSCHFYKPFRKYWETDGCIVSNETTVAVTVCECYHLTVFGAGLFVPPNSIDFDFVFSHADFSENISIYMTVIGVFICYVVFILWAKFKDQEDLEKLGCIPMPDNDPNDHYIYEIIVMTGLRKSAATDSKVSIVISGDLRDTDVREFGHPHGPKKIFRRGMTNHFVMTTKRPLGDLRLIRVWHDNTGQGDFASWYLKEIVILDIHNGRKYPFVCNQWLGVEHSDGAVDRVIPVSSKEELTEFNHLFSESTSKQLLDGHIWFSVFGRPPGSRFTRVQRVSCCLCTLMTSMLASAMWYGTVSDTAQSGLKFGPFSISYAEIGIGVMTSFIVFPLNFLIVTIFRKSSQRTKRPSRFFQAFNTWMPQFIKSGNAIHLDQGDKVSLTEHTAALTKISGKKKPFLLPFWCRYVGWALFLITVALSTIFVIFYGIQFGDEKCRKWLTSTVTSFVSSVLLTEPLKIFLFALLLSLICRKANEEVDDDWIQDEHDFGLKSDQQFLHESEHSSYRFFEKADQDKLDQARYSRKIELGMYSTVREVMVYAFYVWIVFVLAYGSRDPMSWHHQNNLRNLLLNPRTLSPSKYFSQVSSVDEYWEWTKNVLAPALRAPHWYNGQPNIGERGFIGDHTNRLLGFAVIRQVRIQPNTCPIPDIVRSLVRDCVGNSHINLEQRGNFAPTWQSLQPGQDPTTEYTYQTASDLNNIIATGIADIYSGGGYLVTLIGNVSMMQTTLNRLQNENWIDHFTRAVFVEFSTFDPNINMFSVNQIVAEFVPQGGLLTSAYFQPIKLLPYNEKFSLVELICQVIYIIYVFVFIVKEIRSIKQEGKKYFTHFWSVIEMCIIVCAITTIVTFILRLLETNRVLDIYKDTNGNSVLSLQRALLLDSVYNVGVAFGCFAGTLKLGRLLRFNRRISLVETTFHNCKRDLSNFFVVFLVLFFSFCQFFYLLLQDKMKAFTNFLSTMCVTFAYMMGQQDYKSLFNASPWIAPWFFMVFIFVMSVLMVNVFLTIIITMFIAIKHDSTKHSNEYEILEYVELKMRMFLGFPPSLNQKAVFNNHFADVSPLTMVEKKVDKFVKRIDNMFFQGTIEEERCRKSKQREGIKQSQ